MSGAAFPSPTAAEMAEISRIQYEMEYTEGISQRMRVPEKLKVAPANADLEQGFQEGVPNAGIIMKVPERIVVTGISHLIGSAPYKSFLYFYEHLDFSKYEKRYFPSFTNVCNPRSPVTEHCHLRRLPLPILHPSHSFSSQQP